MRKKCIAAYLLTLIVFCTITACGGKNKYKIIGVFVSDQIEYLQDVDQRVGRIRFEIKVVWEENKFEAQVPTTDSETGEWCYRQLNCFYCGENSMEFTECNAANYFYAYDTLHFLARDLNYEIIAKAVSNERLEAKIYLIETETKKKEPVAKAVFTKLV